MKQDKQKQNWIIDAVLFGGFLVALWLDLTGVAVHQWLGIAVGALAGYHLVAHWSWVEAVTGRFFGRTSKQSRQFYMVDAGLAVGFVTIAATGLAISTWLDLSLTSYVVWRNIHVLASVVTLALVVGKIGLHWRWIVSTARRRIFPVSAPVRQASPGQPVQVATQMGRRDFVRLMAGVGAVALLAGVNALSGTAGDQVEAAPATQAAETSAIQADALSGSATSSCTVRCGRRCSYPGHCHRYMDANNNGRCDLGECLS
jgi:hypothetical protein